MTLGTKHPLQQSADLCKQHLRDRKNPLVEEFISEFEGKERDHTRWSSQFADLRQVDSEMLQRVDAAFEKWLSGDMGRMNALPTSSNQRPIKAIQERISIYRKSFTLVRSFLFCWALAVVAVNESVYASDQATVTIKPAQITLHPSKENDRTGWKLLTLSVTNKTKHRQRFSRFYDCWSPVLFSEDHGYIFAGHSRDATLMPTINDYPVIMPGRSAMARRGCRVIGDTDGLALFIDDGTGGQFAADVEPGHYKLAISYHYRNNELSMLRFYGKGFGVEDTKVWPGWEMSNWIDIIIPTK